MKPILTKISFWSPQILSCFFSLSPSVCRRLSFCLCLFFSLWQWHEKCCILGRERVSVMRGLLTVMFQLAHKLPVQVGRECFCQMSWFLSPHSPRELSQVSLMNTPTYCHCHPRSSPLSALSATFISSLLAFYLSLFRTLIFRA